MNLKLPVLFHIFWLRKPIRIIDVSLCYSQLAHLLWEPNNRMEKVYIEICNVHLNEVECGC